MCNTIRRPSAGRHRKLNSCKCLRFRHSAEALITRLITMCLCFTDWDELNCKSTIAETDWNEICPL